MKYKVGDKVKVKSLEWYNSKKEYEDGFFVGRVRFDKDMSNYCGKTAVITKANENSLYYKIDIDRGSWFWYDWMFEDEQGGFTE